jgi:hypothetical protein
MAETTDKMTDGAAAAAIVASGIGATVLGLMIIGAEMSKQFATMLTFNKAVGPLSGKTIIATLGFLISWAILHFMWKDKEVNFGRMATIGAVLITIGILLTFPPIFDLFAPK